MRAQSVVVEADIRVAVHVELHDGRFLVDAAEHQPPRHRQAGVGRVAGSLGVVGRQYVATPAGSRFANKRTGSLFESKYEHK